MFIEFWISAQTRWTGSAMFCPTGFVTYSIRSGFGFSWQSRDFRQFLDIDIETSGHS